jgi:hypothetical protein
VTGPALLVMWRAVRDDLARARSLLPAQPTGTDTLARLAEWLDNNELELALDELEGMGLESEVAGQFWVALRTAAERMGLTDRADRLGNRAAGTEGPSAIE